MKALLPVGKFSRTPCGDAGFSLVWVLMLLAAMAALATALAPNLLNKEGRERAVEEEDRIQKLARGFESYSGRNAVLPGANTWAQAVADTVGSDLVSVTQVFPQFATEATSRRVLLIDPRFQPNTSGAILPFSQTSGGIDPVATPALVPNIYARALLASSSKRGLVIPYASGLVPAAMFDQLWDWAYDPSTASCPLSTVNPNWTRQGQNLHLGRIDLRGLFHLISFRKLTFSANRGAAVMIAGTGQRYFLKGTTLDLYALTNGMRVLRHVVEEDSSFDLASPYEPLVWWGFENGGPPGVAINSGKLGSAADGQLTNGCSALVGTLKTPTYPGYSTNNASLTLDGTDDYVDAHQPLMNSFTQFTLSCWINPATLTAGPHRAFCGQYGVVQAGFTAAGGTLELQTASAGTLTAAYAHPASEWHHVAFSGDGLKLRIYVDGALVATGGSAPTGGYYGSSASAFRAGGGGIFSLTGNFFQGAVDEVCLFDKALSLSRIVALVTNQLP